MGYDQARIDEAVLALLAAFSFDNGRAWKCFDFEVMDRLYEQGLIDDPKGKAKSVWLTEQGITRGRQCAQQLFGSQPRATASSSFTYRSRSTLEDLWSIS